MEARNANGTFRPGHPGYKPKGSRNEFQQATKEKLGAFLLSKLDDLPEVYEKLSHRDKAKMILSISEFFLPKQKELFLENPVQDDIDYSQWPDEDLSALMKLIEKNEQNEQS